ncbi:hypothetical protein GCM10009760_26020 [Kitasatospora kazusensis]|uniref:N-acetylmuramoyl-L-alanine amidase n=1 Tax=Kitasatospora kazusensis TaxID=407974 RepID=A0ABN2ZFZ1_9ACTN
MALFTDANWRGPVPNKRPGAMSSHRLLVVHIEEGSESGSDSWFHNPDAQVSSHFGNPKTGRLDQWVDTDDRAWAEAAYNDVAVSVEHEGNSGDSPTPSQLENDARLLAWLHQQYGTALQVTNDPNGSGVIGHGLLGVAGGNHPDCPGNPILNARQAIVDRAKQILGQGTPGPAPQPEPSFPGWPGRYLSVQSPMLSGDDVRQWQQQMADRGWNITADGWYGPASASIARQFQQEKGLGVDGVVGPATWQAAWTAPVT